MTAPSDNPITEPPASSALSNTSPPAATKTAASGPRSEFAAQSEQAQPGLVAELFDFLRHYKLWWLTPIVLVLLLVGALIFLSGTAAAPFIYQLF